MKEKEAKVSKHIAWSFMPLSFVLVILVTTTVLLLISDKNCLVHAARKKRRNGHPQSRGIRVLNQCGVKVDIYWINPDTGELASSSTNGDGIMYGGETGIDSYVGHEFEVREVENPKTKQCRTPNKCLTNYFEVNVNEDQIFTLTRNLESITVEDNKSRATKKAKEALDKCNEIADKIASLTSSSGNDDVDATERTKMIDQLTECLQEQIQNQFDETKHEIEFQASVRKDMGQKLKNYICDGGSIGNHVNADVFFSGKSEDDDDDGDERDSSKTITTKSVRNSTWTYYSPSSTTQVTTPGKKNKSKKDKQNDYINHPLRILFESDYSSITQVKEFISKDQCKQIIDATSGRPGESNSNDGNQVQITKITKHMTTINFAVRDLIVKADALLSSFFTKSTRFPSNYYTSKASGIDNDDTKLMELRTLTYVPVVSQATIPSQQDCEMQTDGSCLPSTITDTDSSTVMTNVRVTSVDNTTVANLIIFCHAPTTTTTTTTKINNDNKSKTSGLMFFPKTGVKILPNENIGDAVLIVHEDIKGFRDKDPYVDEYITCPISTLRDGNPDNVVVTIEDTIRI